MSGPSSLLYPPSHVPHQQTPCDTTMPQVQQPIYVPQPQLPSGAQAPAPFHYAGESKEIGTAAVYALGRTITRTPSPTPSETEFLQRNGFFDWEKMKNWRWWFRREWIWRYIILIIVIVFATLLAVYDKDIVHGLQPAASKLKTMPAGWLIPIAIFFVISFPPLFGHEILAMLCGVIWGFWVGFGITAAGTLLGEIGNFYAFRWCLRSRGEKYERKNIQYGCLARVIREGGFKMALIARYSAVPGHLLTAIFSTAGINVFLYITAAVLSLPKQAALVIVGVALEESGNGTESTKDKIVSAVTVIVTSVVTFFAMRYIFRRINDVKESVIYDRRKWRQAKNERKLQSPSSFNSDIESNSTDSNDVPLYAPKPMSTRTPADEALTAPLHHPYMSSASSVAYEATVQPDRRYSLQ